MSETTGEIVVKGGSVHVTFDGALYQKDSGDPLVHKHDDRKIVRVKIEDENGLSRFDTDVNEDGLKWTITISTQ
jgi:hypothetical protein